MLAIIPAAAASAAPPPCPLVADTVVAQAIGSPVHGGIMTDFISDKPLETPANQTVCWWDSDSDTTVTLSRQTDAYGPGGATGPAELAQSLFRLPDEARAEVQALHDAGVSDVQLPNYVVTTDTGIGDGAVWVFQHDTTIDLSSGGFVVKRGVDALIVGVIGPPEPDAKTKARALAQAVLASL
jgi:hypothetical protein